MVAWMCGARDCRHAGQQIWGASPLRPVSTFPVLTRPEDIPAVRRKYVRVLFLLVQIMYLSLYSTVFNN